MSSYDVAVLSLTVRSTTETSAVGTRKAMPVSLPLTSGMTLATALAAPVDDGMMLPDAQRPPRQSLVYNAVSNELVRTKTLVKNAIVQVDAQPFKQWYLKRYGVELGKKKKQAEGGEKKGAKGEPDAEKKSRRVLFKLKHREAKQKLDPSVEQQFAGGRLLACIASRPGQCGRADGYILEGDELTFYIKKLEKKKKT